MLPSLLITLLSLTAVGHAQDRAPLLEQRKLRQAISKLASDHSELVTHLPPLGWSRGGPDDEPQRIEVLRLAAGDLMEGRPAILLVANLDGPLVYTSGIALDVAQRLADDYAAGVPEVRELLDTTTLYVVPRANPDGAMGRFARVQNERRGTGHDVDGDRDGAAGEDGPGDVNGDQIVTWLRVPDPEGEWRADPADPRVLVEANRARGERGIWRLVPEGRDEDGDGEVGEDPRRDAEVNRNFPAGFEEHNARAGLYPGQEPETRSMIEFVLGHPDLQLVVVYGDLDNLVEPPESVDDDAPDESRVPPAGWRSSDADLLAEIGRDYAEHVTVEATGDGEDAGTFQRWAYGHRGLFTLAIRPWEVPLEEGGDEDSEDGAEEGPTDDALRLAWLEARGVDAHIGWSAFDHPELGAVEVGGFRPFALVEPPTDERARIADEQRAFLLTLGARLARVSLTEVTWKDLGGGLLEVRATVANEGFLPLLSTWGRRTRTTRPAKVLLRIPASGGLVAGQRQTLIEDLAGLGGRRELRWIVRDANPDTIGVSVETDHAGRAQAQPEKRR